LTRNPGPQPSTQVHEDGCRVKPGMTEVMSLQSPA
jgi:hypothetical protein